MRRLLFAVVATLVCACSSETTPNSKNPPPPKPTSGIQVEFDLGKGTLPNFLSVPWPSDVYLESDGTIADKLPGLDTFVRMNADKLEATLGKQKGFGLNTGALFQIVDTKGDAGADSTVPAAVDVASLPGDEAASLAADASVMLIDLDATSAAEARVAARADFHDDSANGSTTPPLLSIMPARGIPLAEGHRHAAVVTTKVTAGGKAVGPSDAFAAIRDGTRNTSAEKLYGDAIDRVEKLVPALADGKDIAGLTMFTTMDASDELGDMRAIVAAMAAPKLDWTPADIQPMFAALFADHVVAGYTATFDDWLGVPAKLPNGQEDPAHDQSTGYAHDALAAMGTAVFEAPNFLQVKSGGYDDPDHATIARDAKGKPTIDPEHPTAKIWVTIALPKGTMPPAGFPVVIIQHGLQSDRSFILALANTMALEGWATVAIETPTFGARSADASDTVDALSNFPWSSSAAYNGPDGFVDTQADALALFGDFVNFGAARDQLREGVIDLGTLADVVTNPALDLGPLLDAVPGAKFDASRLGFFGDSLGSIHGLMVASVDPKIRFFVLNVGGGGLMTEIFSNGPALASLFSLGGSLYGFNARDRFDRSHFLIQLIQSIVDPADPLIHARYIDRAPRTIGGKKNAPKDVVLIEAIWDELVANEGGEAAARAIGMPLASPNVGSNAELDFQIAKPSGSGIHDVPMHGVTAVLVQASPATHGSDFYNALGKRTYALPFGKPGPSPFAVLPSPIPVHEPYLGLQKMGVAFFASAFSGGTPVVKDFPTPVRDFDDDGHPDASDKYPQDPTKW